MIVEISPFGRNDRKGWPEIYQNQDEVDILIGIDRYAREERT